MSAIETMVTEAPADRSLGFSFLGMVVKAIKRRYATQRQLRRTRVRLLELSDAELADVGLTRDAADREGARSIMAYHMHNAR